VLVRVHVGAGDLRETVRGAGPGRERVRHQDGPSLHGR
jgi:hypothetical protein